MLFTSVGCALVSDVIQCVCARARARGTTAYDKTPLLTLGGMTFTPAAIKIVPRVQTLIVTDMTTQFLLSFRKRGQKCNRCKEQEGVSAFISYELCHSKGLDINI